MAGISPKLPLVTDSTDGYQLNKTFVDSIRQNLFSLMLTVPGERIMDPDFGVGLRKYLFETDNQALRSEITSKISQQIQIYIPFVELLDVQFLSQREDPEIAPNILFVTLTYLIRPLDFTDRLDISVPTN
jgi:phage baseplate assembly protein W